MKSFGNKEYYLQNLLLLCLKPKDGFSLQNNEKSLMTDSLFVDLNLFVREKKITGIFKYHLLFRSDQVWLLMFTLKSKQNYFTCDELLSSPILLFTYPYCLLLEWFILLLNSPWSQENLVLFSFFDCPGVIPSLRNGYI